MANSKRKCGFCGARKLTATMVVKGTQAFCSNEHWIENQVKNMDKLVKKGQKIQRSELKQRKEALRGLPWYKKEAQKWFNKYIRLRDEGLICISCHRSLQKWDGLRGQLYDAGHYRTVGANPELRFNEDNCHGQCVYCNRNLSGNVTNYRIGLMHRIGEERLMILEGAHKAQKYTIDDLKEIIATYKAKWKELESYGAD